MSVAACAASLWQRYNIKGIEDLRNVVFGAELEVVQMAGPRVCGSLAFAAQDGIIYSSGLIDGRVAVRGVLPRDAVTIWIGLRLGPGSLHWLNAVREGDVSVYLPGSEHDAIYAGGSLYVAATLTAQRLEEEAAREGVPLQRGMLAKTGFHAKPIAARDLTWLRSRCSQIHEADDAEHHGWETLRETMLPAVLAHFWRYPEGGGERVDPRGRARIVRRALDYIRENLAEPLSMEVLVRETETPRRTLYRAFVDILDDTPQGFIRRLRLHRIRRELILGAGRGIAPVARAWGTGTDLGRMAARYETLFGESPSMTLAARRERLKTGIWL